MGSDELYFYNRTRRKVLCCRAKVADSFFSRLRGLLGSAPLADGEALYLTPCRSIHMFGMSYAIDALFLDKDGCVVGMAQRIEPNCISPVYRQAAGCLELPPGTIDRSGTKVGDSVVFGSSPFPGEEPANQNQEKPESASQGDR